MDERRGAACERVLRSLAKRAAADDVDVEHVLAVMNVCDATAVPTVQELARRYGWPRPEAQEGSTRVVPLGLWADAVCGYLEDGLDPLVAVASDPARARDERGVAVETIRQVGTRAAVEAMLRVAEALRWERNPPGPFLLDQAVRSLSLMLFRHKLPLSEDERSAIRDLLHGILDWARPEASVATVYCALRWVGDEESLRLIARRAPLATPWQDATRLAAAEINRRRGRA